MKNKKDKMVTGNHKVLTNQGWKRIDKIEETDMVSTFKIDGQDIVNSKAQTLKRH